MRIVSLCWIATGVLTACAAGQRVDRAATASSTDAAPTVETPATIADVDATAAAEDASAAASIDAPITADSSVLADAPHDGFDRWLGVAAHRPQLDRWCTDRGRWYSAQTRNPSPRAGVGPANLSRWRFEARRAPTWTAQVIAPLPRDATMSQEDRAYAALIERAFERAITENASCFESQLEDPSRPVVNAGFIHSIVTVRPDRTTTVSLSADNDSLRSIARCVHTPMTTAQLPPRSPPATRPLVFERVLGICGSTRPPSP